MPTTTSCTAVVGITCGMGARDGHHTPPPWTARSVRVRTHPNLVFLPHPQIPPAIAVMITSVLTFPPQQRTSAVPTSTRTPTRRRPSTPPCPSRSSGTPLATSTRTSLTCTSTSPARPTRSSRPTSASPFPLATTPPSSSPRGGTTPSRSSSMSPFSRTVERSGTRLGPTVPLLRPPTRPRQCTLSPPRTA